MIPEQSPFDRMRPWMDQSMLWIAVVAIAATLGILLERHVHHCPPQTLHVHIEVQR